MEDQEEVKTVRETVGDWEGIEGWGVETVEMVGPGEAEKEGVHTEDMEAAVGTAKAVASVAAKEEVEKV